GGGEGMGGVGGLWAGGAGAAPRGGPPVRRRDLGVEGGGGRPGELGFGPARLRAAAPAVRLRDRRSGGGAAGSSVGAPRHRPVGLAVMAGGPVARRQGGRSRPEPTAGAAGRPPPVV